MKKELLLPFLALFIVNAIYGINFVIAKEVMPAYIKPSGFILIRVTGALILFWIIQLFTGVQKIDKKDFKLLAAGGLFGVAINQLLFFEGLNLSSPINASILMSATPITILMIGVIFSRERLTWLKIAGTMLGASGAVTLIIYSRGAMDTSSRAWLGNIFIILNAISYAIYFVFAKPLMKKYKPLTVITWVFTFGWIFVLPFGLNEAMQVQWQTFTPDITWKTLFVVIGVTFIAYLFNIYALKHVDSSVVGIFIYTQPIIATIHSVWLGKDTITWVLVSCACMIFTGVFMVSRKKKISSLDT
jgi:drug/metabolite transporter (DMT)-like permease